jgi:hypothetical protein
MASWKKRMGGGNLTKTLQLSAARVNTTRVTSGNMGCDHCKTPSWAGMQAITVEQFLFFWLDWQCPFVFLLSYLKITLKISEQNRSIDVF